MKDLALGSFQVPHSMIYCFLWWLCIHGKVCYLSAASQSQDSTRYMAQGLLSGGVSGRALLSDVQEETPHLVRSAAFSHQNGVVWYCNSCILIVQAVGKDVDQKVITAGGDVNWHHCFNNLALSCKREPTPIQQLYSLVYTWDKLTGGPGDVCKTICRWWTYYITS